MEKDNSPSNIRFQQKSDISLNHILNEIDAPTILFNEDGKLLFFNNAADTFFSKDLIDTKTITSFLNKIGIEQAVSENLSSYLIENNILKTTITLNTHSPIVFELTIKKNNSNQILLYFKDHTTNYDLRNRLEQRDTELKKLSNKFDKKQDDLSEAITQLMKSEAYYRMLLKESITGIIISDFNGMITTINDYALKIIEYSREDINKIHLENLFTEFELRRHPLDYDKIRQGAKVIKERYILTKTGKQIPVEMKSRIISNNKIQTIIRDISAEKKAKLELIDSEKKYRELVENISDMIFECDNHFTLKFSNGAVQVLGYSSPKELVGSSLINLIHPHDREIIHEEILHIFPNKHIKHELRIANSIGEFQWIRINIQGKYEQGVLNGYFGTISDISKLKNAEISLKEKNEELQVFNEEYLSQNEELRTALEEINDKNEIIEETINKLHISKETFRTIAENTPDVIARLDRNGVHQFITQNIEKYYKCNYKDYIGKHILDVPYSDDFNIEMNNYFIKVIEQQSQHTFIFKYTVPFPIYLETRLIPEFDDNKNLISVLAITRDITSLKNIEMELIRSKEKAEESDRLKTAFLANMSHEIRTPLNGIIGFSNLLFDEGIENNEKKEFISTINNCSNQLLTIISDIIDISKIESKQVEISVKSCNITAILNSLKTIYTQERDRSEKHNISIILDIPHHDIDFYVDTDEVRVKQILTNLLGNALKFTDSGEIRFGYTIKNNFVEFFVKDTGVGIPSQDIEIIFERFRQSNPQRDKLYGGTGIGLSICKGLVDLLNGEIWVESDLGRQTTFYFTIPIQNIKKNNPTIIDKPTQAILRNIKILAVEDTFYSQRYLQAIFKRMNVELIVTDSAEEGITIFKNNNDIDIILMDIRLPGMNGLDATKIIRNISKSTPIIAQTANAMADDRAKALAAGCNDYIAKPIRRNDLIRIIYSHIQK